VCQRYKTSSFGPSGTRLAAADEGHHVAQSFCTALEQKTKQIDMHLQPHLPVCYLIDLIKFE